MFFIYIFRTRFAISLSFAHLENVSKLWNKNRTMHVIERNQNKNKVMSHSNWPLVLLSDLADKQCNGIIKDFTV